MFTDIDETLTSHGRLTAQAYAALESLQQAGLLVVPVTGRPAGWCDHIARMWPVDAVVGENGAFYFWLDRAAGRLRQRFLQSDAERRAGRQRLDALRTRILQAVPGAGIGNRKSPGVKPCRQSLLRNECQDSPARLWTRAALPPA